MISDMLYPVPTIEQPYMNKNVKAVLKLGVSTVAKQLAQDYLVKPLMNYSRKQLHRQGVKQLQQLYREQGIDVCLREVSQLTCRTVNGSVVELYRHDGCYISGMLLLEKPLPCTYTRDGQYIDLHAEYKRVHGYDILDIVGYLPKDA